MRRIYRSALLAALSAAAAWTQDLAPSWNAPGSGYVFDSATRTVRPIIGLLGSAFAGPPAIGDVEWACLAPNGRTALVRASGSVTAYSDLAAGGVASFAVDGIETAASCAWSADSRQGAVLTGSQVVWIGWHEGAPMKASAQALPELPDASWNLLAADAKAETVLLALRAQGAASLWTASPAYTPHAVATLQDPVAGVFRAGSGDVFVADAGTRQVVRLNIEDRNAETVLDAGHGIDAPTGLALSTDAARLFVADSKANVILAYDLASRSLVGTLPLIEPAGTFSAFGANRYLVNRRERVEQPLLVLDTSPGQGVSFIPMGAITQ